MQLTVITPNKRELNFVIEDFHPISEGKVSNVTEIMLIMLEEKETNMLRHTLEYHSIKTYKCTDNLGVIVDKPKKLRSTQDELILKY